MSGFPDLSKITKILSDESRLDILTILMDGRFHTVHELACAVKIKDHTASYHLKKLHELAWIEFYKQGRYVYYRLSNPDIADLLEQLMSISSIKKINSYNQKKEYNELKHARSCYCHLAGEVGVTFYQNLIEHDFLSLENGQLLLSKKGETLLVSLQINVEQLKKQQGIFCKTCLDWTERQFHLGGNLGKALFDMCLNDKLIIQHPSNRSLLLSEKGSHFFNTFFLSQ